MTQNNQATLNQTMGARTQTRKLTGMAMMAALSVIFLLVIPKIPIFPAAPYLVYDMADVPIILSTFMFGPLPGVMVLAVVSLIQGFFLSPDGLVGAIMHIISSGTLILVAYGVYSKLGKGTVAMIVSLICATVAMAAMMVPLNLIITVHIYGQPAEVVRAALIPAIIPFNLLKAGLNSVIFFVCFKILLGVKPDLLELFRK